MGGNPWLGFRLPIIINTINKTNMKVWIARDDDNGQIVAYDHKPIQNRHMGYFTCEIYPFDGKAKILPKESYPEITWDNSPVEMELDINF